MPPTQSKALVHKAQLDRLIQLISSAQQRGFYGQLTIILEAGVVKRVEKKENLLIPEDGGLPFST